MLYLWLDNVRKPTNLGAIHRLAAALDARLVLTGATPQALSPRARDAAVGYADRVERECFASFTEAAAVLRERGVRLVGTAPRAATPLWQADLSGAAVALVFGNEVGGLGRDKLAALDLTVTIPMPGGVDSLNLATSVAIVAWEALRQRAPQR